MDEFSAFGQWFIYAGMAMILLGILLIGFGQIPWLGNLPGDIYIDRDGFKFYFPLTTCIVLSVLLSLALWILRWFMS